MAYNFSPKFFGFVYIEQHGDTDLWREMRYIYTFIQNVHPRHDRDWKSIWHSHLAYFPNKTKNLFVSHHKLWYGNLLLNTKSPYPSIFYDSIEANTLKYIR